MLYNLKSGSFWKYLSNELSALIIPANFELCGRATTSPSIIVVRAHSLSTLKPVYAATDPFRQIILKSFSFSFKSATCSASKRKKYLKLYLLEQNEKRFTP